MVIVKVNKFPIKSQIFNLVGTLYFIGMLYYSTQGQFHIDRALIMICAVLVTPYSLSAIISVLLKIFSAQKFLELFRRSLLITNIAAGMAIVAFATMGFLSDRENVSSSSAQTAKSNIAFMMQYQNDAYQVKTKNFREFCVRLKHKNALLLYPVFVKKVQHGRGYLTGVIIANCSVSELNLIEDDIKFSIQKLSDNQNWQLVKDISPLIRPQKQLTTIYPGQSLNIYGFTDSDSDVLSAYRFVLVKNKNEMFYSDVFKANISWNSISE
jgi:hypothetical protein